MLSSNPETCLVEKLFSAKDILLANAKDHSFVFAANAVCDIVIVVSMVTSKSIWTTFDSNTTNSL